MKILVLGRGKTGSLVAEVAAERGHQVTAIDEFDNPDGSALTPEYLKDFDVAIDFTAPAAVMANIESCVRAGKNMVVGTTGWYEHIPQVETRVKERGSGLVFGSNFSIGVNLFFEIIRTAADALRFGYTGQIMERHHIHKKDAPSGTAVMMQRVIKERSGKELEIASVREGETVGMHVLMLDSGGDSILLTHDAKSRRGFAEGAVRAAEWIAGKQGFYDFKDIYRQLG